MASENRFAYFTPDNHSAWPWVASLLSLIYATLILALRLGFVKREAHSLDDMVLTLAHFVGIAMWGSLFVSLNNGLGKSFKVLSDANISEIQQSFFASRILLYIALALSKCSILILILHVFEQNHKVSHLAKGTMAVVAIWGLVSVLAGSVTCSSDIVIPKSGSGHCVNLIPWLKAVAVGDVFTELIIMLLPIIGFYDSLMPTKRRVTVILAFFTRFPNIVFSLVYLIAYSKFINDRQPAISIVSTVTWQNALLSYNLMSATIPSLKCFTEGFMTEGVSLGYSWDITTGGTRGTQQSYEMRSISKPGSRATVPPQGFKGLQAQVAFVPQNPNRKSARTNITSSNDTQCYHEESASIASHDSQQVMIKRAPDSGGASWGKDKSEGE